MRVYLNSTSADLKEHRAAVYEALALLRFEKYVTLEVVRVEDQVASGQAPLFAEGEPGVSRAAAYLREHLPEIAYPESSAQRGASIYSLLRTSCAPAR
jgi:hypothetical protein